MKKHKFRVLTSAFLAALSVFAIIFAPDHSDAAEKCEADICLTVPDSISISLNAGTNEAVIDPLILENSSTTSSIKIDKISAEIIDSTYSFEPYASNFSSFAANSKKLAIAIEALDSTVADVTGTTGYALNEVVPAGNTSKFNLKGKSSVFTNSIIGAEVAKLVVTFSATESSPRISDCFSTELEKWTYTKNDALKTITIGKFLGDGAFSTPEWEIPNDKNIIICNSYMINGESYTTKLGSGFNVEENGEAAKSVIFGSNVNSAELTSAKEMFLGMMDLEEIQFPNNFGPNITTTEGMFESAGENTTINANLTALNTSNVTNMERMFSYSGFETLDLSNFDTSKVEFMWQMFIHAEKVEELDLTSFDTSSLTDLECTFNHMLSLKTLDLSSFNTSNVTNMWGTFFNSSALETVYVGDDWSTEFVDDYYYIFGGAKSLVGGMGTKWNSRNSSNIDFARADEAEYDKNGNYIQGNKGYFTYKCSPKALFLDDGTLYFTCDNTTYGATGTTTIEHDGSTKTILTVYSVPSNAYYDIEDEDNDMTGVAGWTLDQYNGDIDVAAVSIANNFYNFKPTSTAAWFAHMNYAEVINGLEYLNLSKVTDMSSMFVNFAYYAGTWPITDLSQWNTSNVTNMSWMFAGAGSESDAFSLDLSSWNVDNVTNMRGMFADTFPISTLNLSNWNTANVTDVSYMFEYSGVEYIIVDSDWTFSAGLISTDMFRKTTYLTGGAGTSWGEDNPSDKTYARIDGGEDNPGYFTGPDQIPRYAKVIVDTEGNVSFNYDYTDYYAPGDQYTSAVFGTKTVDDSYYLGDDSYNDDMDEAWWARLSYGDKEIINVNIEDGFKDLDLSTIYSDTIDFVYDFNDIIRTVNEKRTVNLTNLKNINMTGISNIDGMFSDSKIGNANFNELDTSNVESMCELFLSTTFSKTVDISNFDTSSAVDLSEMFRNSIISDNIIFPENFGSVAETESYMFSGATIQGDLDLTNLNTASAEDLSGMFEESTISGNIIFPENFGSAATDMSYMFRDNTSINSILDISKFNTENVLYMSEMFRGASNITQTIFPNNFAPNVENTYLMFEDADSITSLDLSTFEFRYLAEATGMFGEMDSLEEIIVPASRADWKYRIQDGYSDDMFTNTPNLPGYSSENANDETYAHAGIIDGIQGYFTSTPYNDDSKCVGECEAKTLLLESNELVFVYDSNDYTEEESYYQTNRGESMIIEISTPGDNTTEMRNNAVAVYIANSFADYTPTSTEEWFYNLPNIESIIGLERINTSNVTEMIRMFKDASSLTELDISGFDMSNVENVYEMFSGMTNLEHIYVNTGTDWENLSNITIGGSLFDGDTKLLNYNKSYTTSYYSSTALRAFIGMKRATSQYQDDRFGLFTDICKKNNTCTIETGGLTFAQAFELFGKEMKKVTVDGYDHYYYKMQDMTPEICSAVKTPTSTDAADTESELLVDTRSDRPYTVAKLLDGNCWMTRDLSLEGNRNLDSTETDIADSSTSIYLKNWSSFSTDPTVVTGTTYDVSNYYVMTNKKSSSNYVNNYYRGWYYNSEAAYATEAQITVTEYQTGNDYTDSVCPKGWDLPSGSVSKTSPTPNMYSMLKTYYSGVDVEQAPLNYTNTSAANGLTGSLLSKSGGYYITSTVNHQGYDEVLASGGINTVHTNGTSVTEGAIPGNTILASIRCVAASSEWSSPKSTSSTSSSGAKARAALLGLQQIEGIDTSEIETSNKTNPEEETAEPLGVEENTRYRIWIISLSLFFFIIILPLIIILIRKKKKDDEQYIEKI